MKSISLVRIGVFAASLATLASSAFPITFQAAPPKQGMATVNQSASGKVSAVANDGFSLDVKAGDASSTFQFFVDAKTKVNRSVEGGATASVDERTDDQGRNIDNS